MLVGPRICGHAVQVGALLQSRTKGFADSLKSKGFSPGKCNGARIWKGTRSKVAEDGEANYRRIRRTVK
jgi:hypothetical protein